MTPACSSDAGAATVSLEVMGMAKVATTPKPNTAIMINSKSGLRFTLFLSLILSDLGYSSLWSSSR